PTSRTGRSSASPASRRVAWPGSWRATTRRCWRAPTRPARVGSALLIVTAPARSDALSSLDGHRPVGFLAFDCIARRGVLGDEGIRREVSRIGLHAGAAPIAGFYTYGEIARTNGVSGFHNQTLVILALS